MAAEAEIPSQPQVDVSVIVPTYRRPRQVVEAVTSALNQTGLSLEVLVFDDDPHGSAGKAVRAIEDKRLRYSVRTTHSGRRPAVVRNDGARLARGRYLHFLDDDDVLKPHALAALSQRLDGRPEAGMGFGEIIPFGEDAADLSHNQAHFRAAAQRVRALRSSRELVANLLFHPALLINSACMARREVFDSVGGYDTSMPVCEDTDLWARIVRASGHVFIDQPTAGYCTGGDSLMHSLVENDPQLRSAYGCMHTKYRREHGPLEFYALKVWARTALRLARW